MKVEQISCDEYDRLNRQAEHPRSISADTQRVSTARRKGRLLIVPETVRVSFKRRRYK
jgi:hypothetical protein